MFRIAPLLPISLTLCCVGLVLALVTGVSHLAYRPTPAELRLAIEQAATTHLPRGSMGCGTVALWEDPSQAQACVRSAVKEGTSFWVLSQALGEDTIVWSLFIGEGAERYKAIEFDFYDWQRQGHPLFHWREVACSSPRFGDYPSRQGASYYEPAVWCER